MSVGLAYGRGRLEVPLLGPDPLVVRPQDAPALDDPAAALLAAVRAPLGSPPLRELVRDGDRVVISVCDGTRAQPRPAMLRVLLAELPQVGPQDVTVLIATGTHRGNTPAELEAMLGARGAGARPDRQPRRPRRGALALARHARRRRAGVAEPAGSSADLRITTGFVEPHFFAGFSGGPKMVAPGLAGWRRCWAARRRAHRPPAGDWGVTEGNPVHDDVRAIAARRPASTSRSTCCSTPTSTSSRAFAGELFADARGGPRDGQAVAMRPVRAPFDVVRHDELGLPARPEPLPGGQGHERGRAGCRGRAGRSSARPSAATASRTTARSDVLARAPRRRRCSR